MTGIVSLSANELSVAETDDFASISFRRTGDTSGAVTITYQVVGDGATAGQDFLPGASSRTVTIAAGQTQATIRVPIIDDSLSEATEDFTVAILGVSSGTLNAPRTTRVNILDDENPVVIEPEPPLESRYEVEETQFITYTRPVDIDFVPGQENIMMVAGQLGRVGMFDTRNGAFLGNFINLAQEVSFGGGLSGMALHPDFQNNPYVYLYYQVDPPETRGQTGFAGPDGGGNRFQWLVRYEADLSSGVPRAILESKTILLGGAGQSLSDISGGGALDFGLGPIYADLPASDTLNLSAEEIALGLKYRQNYIKGDGAHFGGGMAFGPDGMLYLAIGDGVAFNFADPRTFATQDPNSLSGKVVRIDPITGLGRSDNPFYQPGDSLELNRSKVYQVGLRNPFSLSFDREGNLVVTDTGQVNYEEINIGAPGANFGWPFYEGADFDRLASPPNFLPTPQNGFQDEWDAFLAANPDITLPFRGFAHRDAEPGYQFQAITGGNVDYLGTRYPSSLIGNYIFSDFSDGEVFIVDLDNRRDVEFLYKNPDFTSAPVHFTQGPDGWIYYVRVLEFTVGRLQIRELVPEGDTIGGVRQVAGLTHSAQTVSYGQNVVLEDAVVFAGPIGFNGRSPATIEFISVGATSATLRIQEPDYLDDFRVFPDSVSLLALERGVWSVGNDRQLVVDTVNVNAPSGSRWISVSFAEAFENAPIVVTQIQSDSGDASWAVVRTRDITSTGFQLRIQEEEANDQIHRATVVGYYALETTGAAADVFEWNGLDAQAFSVDDVTHRRSTPFTFDDDLGGGPIVSGALATTGGGNPANLRMDRATDGSFRFFAHEEQSADDEQFHVVETANGLGFGRAGVLTGVDLLVG